MSEQTVTTMLTRAIRDGIMVSDEELEAIHKRWNPGPGVRFPNIWQAEDDVRDLLATVRGLQQRIDDLEQGQPRPVVAAFAHLMEGKLQENDGRKPGWLTVRRLGVLLTGLRREVKELADVVQTPPSPVLADEGLAAWKREVGREAGDVGNCALFIANWCDALPLPDGVTVDARGRAVES